jgi:hypothetical protein
MAGYSNNAPLFPSVDAPDFPEQEESDQPDFHAEIMKNTA